MILRFLAAGAALTACTATENDPIPLHIGVEDPTAFFEPSPLTSLPTLGSVITDGNGTQTVLTVIDPTSGFDDARAQLTSDASGTRLSLVAFVPVESATYEQPRLDMSARLAGSITGQASDVRLRAFDDNHARERAVSSNDASLTVTACTPPREHRLAQIQGVFSSTLCYQPDPERPHDTLPCAPITGSFDTELLVENR